MSRSTTTLAAPYFEALYAGGADPWSFRTSDYERDKYAATLDALTRSRYADALEVGCSIGVFTRALALRCDRLLAIDPSREALAQARVACADRTNVTFEERMVPADFPKGRFDLIVLSEVLYYLVAEDLDRVAAQCREALAPGGISVLCHWLGETDYPLTGADANDRFIAAMAPRLPRATLLHDDVYRLVRLAEPGA